MNCIDYIIKPLESNKLKIALNKIENNKRYIKRTFLEDDRKKISLKIFNKIIYLDPDEILYITKNGRYTKIVTEERNYLSDKILKEFGKELLNYNIKRIHKSYIVNLNKVKKITKKSTRKYILYIEGLKKGIRIGRSYIDEIVHS